MCDEKTKRLMAETEAAYAIAGLAYATYQKRYTNLYKRMQKIAKVCSSPEAVLDPKSAISKIAKTITKDVYRSLEQK